jgi:two-component system response regulator NreC
MAVRVLLADDHAVVRHGLRSLLEKEGYVVIAEASDGRDAVRQAADARPDIAILDVSMPMMNGMDAARELTKILPDLKVILLTRHDEPQYVTAALRAGVKGYVLKSQAANELVQAIEEVRRGTIYVSPQISRPAMETHLSLAPLRTDPLTPRERQVLQLVGEGKSTKDVAQLLGISIKTAESHRARLMRKLDIHETAGLVRYAIRHGLVQP